MPGSSTPFTSCRRPATSPGLPRGDFGWDPAITYPSEALRLKEPVHLGDSRACRRLLEVAGESVDAISDGMFIVGFVPREAPASASEVIVEFQGSHSWTLCADDAGLLTVTRADAKVPAPPLEKRDVLGRLAGLWQGADLKALWDVISAAQRMGHGGMIVVTESAGSEAVRLGSTATHVKPKRLTPSLARRLAAVDGAILMDPQGFCHAFAVILDGIASATGDPSRGARYNSAIRYCDSRKEPTAIVIVSEDGGIDIQVGGVQ